MATKNPFEAGDYLIFRPKIDESILPSVATEGSTITKSINVFVWSFVEFSRFFCTNMKAICICVLNFEFKYQRVSERKNLMRGIEIMFL